MDGLLEINLSIEDEPEQNMPPEEGVHFNFLKKNRDVFAWTYTEMLGADPKISMHRL